MGDPIPKVVDEEGEEDVVMVEAGSSRTSDVGMNDTPPMSEVQYPASGSASRAESASGAGSVSGAGAGSVSAAGSVAGGGRKEDREADPMEAFSRATDLQVAVGSGAGRGVVIVPGWVRERAAELLFTSGDVDERSVAETVLDSLRKVCPVPLTHIAYGTERQVHRFQLICVKNSYRRF